MSGVRLVERECSFGELVAAFAMLHHVPATSFTAFVARLKNFHRLGLLQSESPGKGKVRRYGALDVYLISFALELSQLGVAPQAVVGYCDEHMEAIVKAIIPTRSASRPVYARIELNALGGRSAFLLDFGLPKPGRRCSIINLSALIDLTARAVAEAVQ